MYVFIISLYCIPQQPPHGIRRRVGTGMATVIAGGAYCRLRGFTRRRVAMHRHGSILGVPPQRASWAGGISRRGAADGWLAANSFVAHRRQPMWRGGAARARPRAVRQRLRISTGGAMLEHALVRPLVATRTTLAPAARGGHGHAALLATEPPCYWRGRHITNSNVGSVTVCDVDA